MREADLEAKAVIFSSWGRLLKLVGDALSANGVQYTSLCGTALQQRQGELGGGGVNECVRACLRACVRVDGGGS